MGGYGTGSRILSILLVGLVLGALGLLEPLIRFWSRFHQVGQPWFLVIAVYLGFGLVCALAASIVVSAALATRSVQRRPIVYAAYYCAGAFALAAVLIAAPLLRRELQGLQFPISYWVLYPALLLLAAIAATKLTPHFVQPLLSMLIGYPSGRISRSRLVAVLVIAGLLVPLTAYKGLSAERWPSGRPARAGLRSRPGSQPVQNLILITIDGLRADHVGAYGYARPTTPVLDSLASRGALFEQCFTQGSRPELAMASLFTSLCPTSHAVFERENHSARLAQDVETLAEGLRDAGLHCIGLMNGPCLARETGLAQGFDELVEFHYGYLELFPWRYLQKLKLVASPELVPLSTLFFRAETVVTEALQQLRRLRGQPFFLYLNLVDTHQPFIPPRRFESAFLSSGATPTEPEELWKMRWPVLKKLPGERVLSNADALRFVDLYDDTIRYVDGEIARLMARLETLGLARNTLVIVTSDRGTEFLEHGQMLDYSELLYDELIHVPLIIAMPGQTAPIRVTPSVRLIDLLPTLHEVFDLPPLRSAQGQSLLPLTTGSQGWKAVPAYSESYTYVALRTPEYKIMVPKHEAGGALCFDLVSDPGEARNLQGQSGVCDSLGLVLEQMRRGF
jgi:arylsulfatase A-like enzyme